MGDYFREKSCRKKNPDYLLVLPWHFKNHILQKENSFIKKGGHFIFPLPDIIGSFIEGALMIFPSSIIANLFPTPDDVARANFLAPTQSKLNVTTV